MKTSSLEPIRYLTPKEMEAIHKSALEILERTGMWIDHLRALEYLRQSGCHVDMDRRRVKFPPEVVEAAVARMRRNFQDPNRWPKRTSVRYSQVRFDSQPLRVHEDFTVSAGGFCCFIWDREGQRRYATMKDVRESLKLADRLDQIAYTGLPCSAQEVPVHLRPVVMAAELVKDRSSPPTWIGTRSSILNWVSGVSCASAMCGAAPMPRQPHSVRPRSSAHRPKACTLRRAPCR